MARGHFSQYLLENQQLYRYIGSRPDEEEYVPWKFCVAKRHRQQVLSECHDHPTAENLGIRKTIIRIALRYYGPGLFRDVNLSAIQDKPEYTSRKDVY